MISDCVCVCALTWASSDSRRPVPNGTMPFKPWWQKESRPTIYPQHHGARNGAVRG